MARTYRISVTHIDTCLSCYLTDHHDREGELLLGVAVDNGTTYRDVCGELKNEIGSRDYGLPDGFSYSTFRRVVDDLFAGANPDAPFDASLDDPSDDDMCEPCQAWFLVTY